MSYAQYRMAYRLPGVGISREGAGEEQMTLVSNEPQTADPSLAMIWASGLTASVGAFGAAALAKRKNDR